jgi:hypothetical protein
MLWKMFKMKGLLDSRLAANEINLVFDNCAGQKKNKMMYRMLFFMVKLGVCRTGRCTVSFLSRVIQRMIVTGCSI